MRNSIFKTFTSTVECWVDCPEPLNHLADILESQIKEFEDMGYNEISRSSPTISIISHEFHGTAIIAVTSEFVKA